MKYLLYFFGAVLLGAVTVVGVNLNERVECYKWQAQAKEYPSFYLVKWQAEQCEAHGIKIDTFVIEKFTRHAR